MKVINTHKLKETVSSIKGEVVNIKNSIVNINTSLQDLFSHLLKNDVREASNFLTHALWGDEIKRIKTATQKFKAYDRKKSGRYGPGVFRRKGS